MHLSLSIQCPNEKSRHADFSVRNGRFICEACGNDFTADAIKVKEGLEQSLKK